LQQAAADLERQRVTNSLKKSLEKRPERTDLIERTSPYGPPCSLLILISGNILPESNAAPALQAQQRELQKHMRKDSLEKHLQTRPKPDELVKEGILQEDESPVS
jgi:RPEL repeat